MKTLRGFEVKYFEDSHGKECAIQESSAWEPSVWLGIRGPKLKVMWKDLSELAKYVSEAKKDSPETNERGWCTITLPHQALIDNQMHLSIDNAKWLIKELEYFVDHGVLKESEEDE